MKKILALICLSCSLPAMAMQNYKDESPHHPDESTGWWSPSRLYLGAYGGYGTVDGAYGQDGQFTQGRLALGLRAIDYNIASFGVETGVQLGNDMRLSASSTLIDASGGLPIQATLKQFIDLLLTVKFQLLPNYPLVAILKGGIAYRQLQLDDRTSSQDSLRKVNGEFQAGLGYKLTEYVMLTALYQGIYSNNNAGISIDATGDNIYISRIPTQQAGFLGLEFTL